ncbi:iron-containing alcohol dehydrogenase [Nocardioides pyridinolyticus]
MSPYVGEPLRAILSAVDPDGELAPCGLNRLVLGSDALFAVADTVADLVRGRAAKRGTVVVLVDPTRILRGGVAVKELVRDQLAERFDVRVRVLDDGRPELHVVDEVLDAATAAVRGADAVVALGGGTISDIGKVAVQRERAAGGQPVLVSVQTAASVDGYTDDVSVVLRGGVKRTVPSCWPDAVVADSETIAGAPAAMTRAGYGEMTSMFVAPADWRLASLAGADLGFKAGAVRLLEVVGRDIDGWSPGIREAEPRAVAALTRALALRGVATGVAGTTAVLSGVEHLISHMLDQRHTQRHEPMGLHGAQVGVGAVAAAAAWEMLFDRLASTAPALDESAFDADLARMRVLDAFGDLDPSGRVARECWRDYSAKLDVLARLRPRLQNVLAHWEVHAPELRGLARSSSSIAAGLRAAGAASSFEDLEPQVSPAVARWAVGSCALMRNRFTVVDLLTLLGWWGRDNVDEVLARARRAGAAARDDARTS